MKEKYKEQINQISDADLFNDVHEEYSVMDKANRIQLNKDMLEAAGISTNKVKVSVEDGKLIIQGE